MSNSVLKTTSLCVLLIGLWLMIAGGWNGLVFYFFIHNISNMGFEVTTVGGILVFLYRILPFIVGLFLFCQQQSIVRWFCRHVTNEDLEQITWNDSRILSTLSLSLLGLLFFIFGLLQLCDNFVLTSVLCRIDSPSFLSQSPLTWTNKVMIIHNIYPMVLGLLFLFSAVKLGKIIGNKIDQTLLPTSENDEERQENTEESL